MWLEPFLFVLSLQICTLECFRAKKEDKYFEIVGLFDSKSKISQRAFNECMNFNKDIDGLRLKPVILEPSKLDSFTVWRELCNKGNLSPVIIFGPQDPVADSAVRDQCAISQIPHIQATWQPLNPEIDEYEEENNEEQEQEPFKSITINFYPDSDELSAAFAQVLKYYKWESFAVLYEDNYGLMRIQKILAHHTTKYPVTVRQFDISGDTQKVFKELRDYQESRVLLDCKVDNIIKYFTESDNLKMLSLYQHYLLTTLDASMYAEKLIKYNSNITWLSLAEYDGLNRNSLAQRVGSWKQDTKIQPPVTSFMTEEILIDDVAKHVLNSLKLVGDYRDGINSRPFNCTVEDSWQFGINMQKALLETNWTGVTGNIKFNKKGKRTNYTLYINEIHMSERRTIGRWDSDSKSITIDLPVTINKAQSNHLVVISRRAKPYYFPKAKTTEAVEDDDDTSDKDTEEYEGFSVDLVKEIFKVLNEEMHLNYTYEFSTENYKDYGKYDPLTKKWNGLIGSLLDKEADLAVCDLTITEERKKVVDFSVPFKSLGISILYVQEYRQLPGLFSFTNPYSFEVWMYIATSYCVVSITLFVCSRISPADWENPQPCDKDPEELENIWNFKNCTWLTMGSIMTQGCDILPKAIGSRWVCGVWWFFAMIVCQTYIAKLAASMTSALDNEPIGSVEDLAKQNKVLYGALHSGSTIDFFRKSKDKMYQKIYKTMISNPAVLVNDNDEGERRVLKGAGKYAFFMESSTIDYKLKRNCELKKVGVELDSKDYGIAMPANSPFRSDINQAILNLKEKTTLDKIIKRWWEEKDNATDCSKNEEQDEVEGDLEIRNLIGAFLVLIVGLFFSLLITAAEFMNEVRNIVVREKVSHKEALLKELKASLNFFQLQKPVLRNISRAPSTEEPSEDDTKLNPRQTQTTNFLDFEKLTR